MACSSCKQKNKEKFNQINEELKSHNKTVYITAIIVLGLSLYGLYSLISKLL